MLSLLRYAAPLLSLLFPTLALAHPFLDVLPLPPATVTPGSTYVLTLDLFPGDTPVESLQLDFELSSPTVFGPPSAVMGDGFSFVHDAINDPLHFSIVGDFTGSPLQEFGEFPVGTLTMLAGPTGGDLLLLDSSAIVALEAGVPEAFPHEEFSNVRFSDVVVHVVPEPAAATLIGLALVALAGADRHRRRRA
jgi:hypothetical protein